VEKGVEANAMTFESRSSRVSFFGRFSDELSRDDIAKGTFQVSLNGSLRTPHFKDDGFFVFSDLKPSPPTYALEATSALYQSKSFSRVLPANTMVELSFPGEDELIVLSTTIDAAQNRVNFANIPFLRPIDQGAAVLGPLGFSAALAVAIEGNDVDFALLDSVVGLNSGDPIRIVRSTRMLLRPGPYYQFPARTTLLALSVVETAPGTEPVGGARIEITQVNGQAVNPVVVGGLSLNRVDVPATVVGDPPIPVLLGPAEAVVTRSNTRGHAIFYYQETTPITAVTIAISKAGYVTTTVTEALTPSQRTQQTIPLPRV
jgi:hypothetical protein